jgi:hypothetical protein
MASKKKYSGYTDVIAKMDKLPLYIEIGGNLTAAKDKQVKVIREVLEAWKILNKAEKEGIYLEGSKIIYLDSSNKTQRIFAKEDNSSSDIPPTPKKNVKISKESTEEEVPTRASTPAKGKTPAKKPPIKKVISEDSFSEDEKPIIKKVVKAVARNSPAKKNTKKIVLSDSSEEDDKPGKPIVKNSSEEDKKFSGSPQGKVEVKNTTMFPNLSTAARRASFFDHFYSLYEPRFAPPTDLARRLYVDDKTHDKYSKTVEVYVPADADNKIIIRLINEREPVNIGMKRYYNLEELKHKYGYVTSYYQRHYEATGELAPNIGVYMLAPIIKGENVTDIHLYNAIGYALDNKDQVDYMYVRELASVRDFLFQKYILLLRRAFQCAKDHNLKRIIMPILGGGAFATLYPGGGEAFRNNVFLPAFKIAIIHYYKFIQIDFMGDKEDSAIKTLAKTGHKYVGYFPDCIYAQDFDKNETMVINAWDCHTVLGNGNGGDNSLDGYVGRNSAIQFFGFGLGNLSMENRIIKNSP